jgi:predicted MFS family arabinose efflux permease
VLLWGGQAVSTLGTTASQIVYSLLILALTGSPAAAGIAAALHSVPYIVLSLPVGALIDRWDRKRVMILCDLGRALTLASIPVAMWLNALTVWQLYVCALVEGSLFVLFNIAEVAALPRVVEKADLPQAAALNEVAYGVASVVGPSFGTVLYQTFGRALPFIADAVSYLLSILSLSFIKTEFQTAREPAPRGRLRAEVAEGMRWLWGNPLVRFMALQIGGMNMVEAGAPLLIIVLAKGMGATDAEIGLIFSIGGVGAIVGALIGGQVQKRLSFGRVIISTTWGMALMFLLYAVAPGYWWLGAVTGFGMMVGPIFNVTQFSYRLALIPDELQGRVNSTFRLLAFGLNPIGAALSGVLIERIGATSTVVLFGAWLVVLAVLTTVNPHVRNAGAIRDA